MQSATAPVALDVKRLRIAGIVMLAGAFALRFLSLPSIVVCPLRATTGVPCPFCGMTRSVAAIGRGDLGASLTFNPGGILLVVLAIVVVVAWRWRRITIPTWGLVAFFAVLWIYQLFKYTTGRPL